MTIDPTREEWLAARERVSIAVHANSSTPAVVIAILGPCPPEPAPPWWQRDGSGSLAVLPCDDHVPASESHVPALYDRAINRVPASEALVCGYLVADEDVGGDKERCQRPVGHDGWCLPRQVIGDE